MNDLAIQKQRLEELKQFLNSFIQVLDQNIATYNSKFGALSQTGLSKQVIQGYDQNYKQPEIQQLKQLIQRIKDADIPYVNQNIAAIQAAIDAAKQTR